MHYRSFGGSEHADFSEFAKHISRVLITNPVPEHFDAIVLQNEAAKRDLCIEWTSIVSPNYDLGKLVGIAINTTSSKDTLTQAFSLASRIQEQRIARRTHFPVTIINCSRKVLPPTRADFLRYGCYVASCATPEQIVDLFDTALVDARRRSRRGIAFVFRGGLPPSIILSGRQHELEARGRLLSLLIALSRERRAFSSAEISVILNCKIDQVKVYVDRLRRLIATTGRGRGISIGKQEVIQNTGKKGGYCLHANVGGLLPPQ